jgi:BarA-like signal transduction histidine kinase
MGMKKLEILKKKRLILINPNVNSALHIYNILFRQEINLNAEWKMGLNTKF